MLGSFLAAKNGSFNWTICLLAILTTTVLQVLSNFANDYGDGVKGTDNEDRIGPERALQSGAISPKEMKGAVVLSSIVALGLGVWLILEAFGLENFWKVLTFLILGLGAIAAAIKYTMGKGAYGYAGFGDLFVFLFFGLIGVIGSYYLYVESIDWLVVLPAISFGLLSAGVLNLNNMRDQESDLKAGKHTLVVKIGSRAAKVYHTFLLITPVLLCVTFNLLSYQSSKQFLFLLIVPVLVKNLIVVWKEKDLKKLDPLLKQLALGSMFFALLFGIGQICLIEYAGVFRNSIPPFCSSSKSRSGFSHDC